MSSLGMNAKGELRSAFEFKDIYDTTGQSFGPYCCPFCEAPFEDRCIVKPCVKAPHFKLPNGTWHGAGCTGEDGILVSVAIESGVDEPQRRVVGDVQLPEALVARRVASTFRLPGEDGQRPKPDLAEIERRRKLAAADSTLSSRFTTSLLRPIASAYLTLLERARAKSNQSGAKAGSPGYKATFR